MSVFRWEAAEFIAFRPAAVLNTALSGQAYLRRFSEAAERYQRIPPEGFS